VANGGASQSGQSLEQNEQTASLRSDDAVATQIKIKDEWESYLKFWFYLHYFLGAWTILLSTLIASTPEGLTFSKANYSVIAWILAASTGIFAMLNPNERGTRYRKAWSLLNSAITRYRAKQISVEEVLAAYETGEDIIHENTSGSPFSTKERPELK
jgi:hypothetical protein